MRKLLSCLLACGVLLQIPSLEAKNFKLDAGAGYRQDFLQWELAGSENMPKVMSRLTWEDLHIFETWAQLKKITCQHFYLRGSASYGRIFSGKNRDSDYALNRRTGEVVEFLRSDNNAGRGDVFDFSGGAGYFIRCDFIKNLRLIPLVGYGYDEQDLHMYKGFHSINLADPIFEGHHFIGLHSTYKAKWYGPWAGADLYYHWNETISLTGTFEYHWLQFRGIGHWNLREDILGNFHHTAHGHGYFATAGIDYNFCAGWYIGGLFKFEYARANKGIDRTVVGIPVDEEAVDNGSQRYNRKLKEGGGPDLVSADDDFSDSSSVSSSKVIIPFVAEGKLGVVKWYSFSLLFTIGYNF